jgi:hypothetical protein
MLKYKPKQFWNMLKSAPSPNTDIPVAAFIEYNKKIFYDASIPEDNYAPV